MSKARIGGGVLALIVAGVVAFLFFGPLTSSFRPPDLQGQALLVTHEGQARLWILLKQEEVRQVRVGGGIRSVGGLRSDTHFHFDLQAHDVRSAAPAWKRRLLSLGDAEASGGKPSRVLGSNTQARLLGQDGDTVWVLVDNEPLAVSAADGSVKANAAALQALNPALKGLLPATADLYAFERGLVLTAADAQRYRLRGTDLGAEVYQPPPPPPRPASRFSGVRIQIGEPVVRQTRLAGTWLGLYSDREAADASDDERGVRYNEPFSVLDEGKLARRSFRRATIGRTLQWPEDRIDRLFDVKPVPGSLVFLRGQFVHTLGTDDAMPMADPAGVLVQHQTRIDAEGRVAITRIDATLKAVWTATLPMTELGARWIAPGQLLLLGTEESTRDGVRTREGLLLALDVADGKLRGWNLQKGQAMP